MNNRPTPEDIFRFPDGLDMPAEILMWDVNTENYKEGKGCRVGMVSRGWGFEDSPDAEVISGGESTKAKNAVTIGRHGNFLLWGFAGAPDYMTEEAKIVFANAVVYINQFKGQKPIARKYNDRIATREYVDELLFYTIKKSFDWTTAFYTEWNASMMKEKELAANKKAAGEVLNDEEKRMFNFEPNPLMTRDQYLKKNIGRIKLIENLVTDTLACRQFLTDNLEYLYSEPDGFYDFKLDEDAKSLGISNRDVKILDKCIELLEKNEDVEKAKRILDRYTLCNFKTPSEWREWYTKYKDIIFFTETGGYYFMVNSRDKNVEGNDYQKKELESAYEKIKPDETDDKNAVSIATGIVDKGNGKKEIVVKFKIHPGYYIYAFVAKTDPYKVTDVQIELPEGYTKTAALKKPSFTFYNDRGTTIYNDEVVFTQKIVGSGTGEVICSISYQCCDSHICFPPVLNKPYTVVIP